MTNPSPQLAPAPCPRCSGNGLVVSALGPVVQCGECDGTGQLTIRTAGFEPCVLCKRCRKQFVRAACPDVPCSRCCNKIDPKKGITGRFDKRTGQMEWIDPNREPEQLAKVLAEIEAAKV